MESRSDLDFETIIPQLTGEIIRVQKVLRPPARFRVDGVRHERIMGVGTNLQGSFHCLGHKIILHHAFDLASHQHSCLLTEHHDLFFPKIEIRGTIPNDSDPLAAIQNLPLPLNGDQKEQMNGAKHIRPRRHKEDPGGTR